MRVLGRDDREDLGGTYEDAVKELMSPLHQVTDKESLKKSAERRVKTVSDMRRYFGRIQFGKDDIFKPPKRMIHITGTKGKGSTACFCQSILNCHGYSTGLFTSPHLIDIRERIRLDGRPVHQKIFAKAYWKIRKDLETYASANGNETDGLPTLPGYFRMLTLMAFYTFSEVQVDIWIVEVGMGGRYDATNFLDRTTISHRSICGVTLLDFDHTRVLGTTLEQIAWEKGGIFAFDKATTQGLSPKPIRVDESHDASTVMKEIPTNQDSKEHVTVQDVSSTAFILDSNTDSVLDVFRQCATNEGRGGMLKTVDARGAELRAVLGKRTLGIAGDHQYGNANLAIHLCNAVTAEDTGKSPMPSLVDYLHETNTLQGLMQANWPARCQTVSRPGSSFEFRLDGAHTPLSLTATMEWFTKKSALTPRRILIFNCSHERNPRELLDILKDGKFACVYFAKPDSSRPSPVREQTAQELLEEANISVHDGWVNSIRKQRGGEETWQETLGILWKHLVPPSSRKVTAHGGHVSLHAVPLVCNKTSREIIRDLSTTSIEPTEVLVTGSLYLVGSFLTALEWSEESSPDQSALLE